MVIGNGAVKTALFIDQQEREVVEKKGPRLDLHPTGNHGTVPRKDTGKKLN